MSFKILKGNARGFTLVELMVVVAIIGILSSVAIPSFKRYQAKAKTSEAKLHLASVYSAEVSFFSDADAYSTCLSDMGYNPHATKEQRYYSTGFEAEGGPDTGSDNEINGINCTKGEGFNFPRGKTVGGNAPPGDDIDSAAADIVGTFVDDQGSGFVAGAGGVIDSAAAKNSGDTGNIFKKSIDAYAEEEEGEADEFAVKEAIKPEDCDAQALSIWGVNDKKEILEACSGYGY